MAKTVDGVVYAMHTFVVEGGDTGVTAQEALDRVAVEHPNVHLYEVVTVKANPGDVGIVMVGVSGGVVACRGGCCVCSPAGGGAVS